MTLRAGSLLCDPGRLVLLQATSARHPSLTTPYGSWLYAKEIVMLLQQLGTGGFRQRSLQQLPDQWQAAHEPDLAHYCVSCVSGAASGNKH